MYFHFNHLSNGNLVGCQIVKCYKYIFFFSTFKKNNLSLVFCIDGCKLFKVYQNLVTTSPFSIFFYHVKTHLRMIMMESIIAIV
jgi:hypothetical protein